MKIGPQGVRYAVVGALAFCVDFGVTWLAVKALPLLAANTIGFIAANVFNFVLAHGWVFGARFERKRFVPAYAAVLTVSLVGLLVNNAVVWILVGLSGMALLPGKIIATLAGLVWNFSARKFWIYKSKIQ
jgi:putative flippase GtrA